MAQKRIVDLQFPRAGLNRRFAYQAQPPFSTVDCLNVRSEGTFESRERGGSRPGLAKVYDDELGTISITGTMTLGAGPPDNPTDEADSEVTATGAVFIPSVVGENIVFDNPPAGNGTYEIIQYISDTVVRVSGNASAELAEDTFAITESDGQPIRMLGTIQSLPAEGAVSFFDDFDTAGVQQALANNWTQPTGADGLVVKSTGADDLAHARNAIAVGETDAAIRPAVTLDPSSKQTITVPYYHYNIGVSATFYQYIYMGLLDVTPDISDACVKLKMYKNSTAPVYEIIEVNGGVETILAVDVLIGGTIGDVIVTMELFNKDVIVTAEQGASSVTIKATLVNNVPGTRCGMGIEFAGGVGYAWQYSNFYSFRWDYVAAVSIKPNMLVTSANKRLYYTNESNVTTDVNGNYSLASDRSIQHVDRLGYLYIADTGDAILDYTDTAALVNGTALTITSDPTHFEHDIDFNTFDYVIEVYDGATGVTDGTYTIASFTGTAITLGASASSSSLACKFRIVRGAKRFYSANPALTLWHKDLLDGSGSGYVPVGCRLICVYRDRLVLAGDSNNPHVWYMSRQGDPLDWDYGASDTDPGRAMAGDTSFNTDRIGEPIIALIPGIGDYMLFGCQNSLHVMHGDPGSGGIAGALSRTIGVLDKNAWCTSPEGETIFLSRGGVYMIPPGAGTFPVPISRELLPEELIDVDPTAYTITMNFDTFDYGVHIFLTRITGGLIKHWWIDWQLKSFWPVSIPYDYEPTAACLYKETGAGYSDIVLGGRDGYLRHFRDLQTTDDGTNINSYVLYGPFRVDGYHKTMLNELICELDDNSGDVTWDILVGDTSESASKSSSFATGTFSSGMNYKIRPRARGASMYLELSSTNRWAVERITAALSKAGVHRIN